MIILFPFFRWYFCTFWWRRLLYFCNKSDRKRGREFLFWSFEPLDKIKAGYLCKYSCVTHPDSDHGDINWQWCVLFFLSSRGQWIFPDSKRSSSTFSTATKISNRKLTSSCHCNMVTDTWWQLEVRVLVLKPRCTDPVGRRYMELNFNCILITVVE